MADYCTLEDLKKVGLSEKKIIQLTNDGKADTINEGVLTGCIAAAKTMIDGFAVVKYSAAMPFDPVPGQIKTITAILTKYFLYEFASAVDEKIQKLYDGQMALLRKLSTGTFKLLDVQDKKVKSDGVTFTQKKPTDRAFHPSKLGAF